jgi:hypothetical protein
MIKILLRPGHHLMARCARSSDCATDEGLGQRVLGFLTKALVRCLAAKNAVRAVVVVVVHRLLQFLRDEVGVVDDLAFEGAGLVIAEPRSSLPSPALWAGLGGIAAMFAVKMLTKVVAVWRRPAQ